MSPKRIELLFSALIVLLLAWGLWTARTWPVHSRIFPWSIGFGVLLLALAQLIRSVREVIRSTGGSDVPDDAVRRRVLVMCGWILVFFLGIWLLGFRVGSFLLTLAFLRFGASESWRVSVSAGGVSYLFFLLVFHFALQVPLAPGLLTESLGLESLDTYLISRLLN